MGKISTWETEFVEAEKQMIHVFANGLRMVVSFKLGRYWLSGKDGCMLDSGTLDIKVIDWNDYLVAISKR